ncbi:unnamed protein product [Rotaria sordida]|uniref:LITAF domain-containing protein n=1 Tax=Rotaria sordida TaxID=392033 RepID=A0A815E2U9_9BILA|nr:unnamed protein product [Rotaria sordida]CAF3838293.1 unnamed protein product [Rotaria sordida]
MDKQNEYFAPPPPPPHPEILVPIVPIRGQYPVRCVCINYHQNIVTRIEKKNGLMTWASVGGICFFGAPCGCFLGCCLIPLCIDDLKDTVHHCPNCSIILGIDKMV